MQFSVWRAAGDSVAVDRTLLEVELKGVCESYDVVVEPCVLLIPGQIMQDTVIRRKFKVTQSRIQFVLIVSAECVCSRAAVLQRLNGDSVHV